MPLVIFALVLLVPFLNFEFTDLTFYRGTLKVFVFQTATTLLWGYLLWLWCAGKLRAADWPSGWLFAPLALWVAWGLATMLWSPRPWLAGHWAVEGFYGLMGALGLSLLLRERSSRRMFVAAASAVVCVVAVFMAALYGDPQARFFGDRDLSGRGVGAAFLLVPTLAAAALLYGRNGTEGEEEAPPGYAGVIWLAVLLSVLLIAGSRAGLMGWFYALCIGLAILVWLLLPRWRIAAVLLVPLVLVVAYGREAREREAAANFLSDTLLARQGLLDATDWGLLRSGSPRSLALGHGVGTYLVALDLYRPPRTYAVSGGDATVGHARRTLVEVLFERGIVGLLLALAAGAACVAVGCHVLRRAKEPGDGALAAGLAAGVVAMGVFACFLSGGAGFGAKVSFWVAVGILGALSARHGREAVAWSPDEEAHREDAGPRPGTTRAFAASAAGLIAVAAWFLLAARPFWADYCLGEGQAEYETSKRLAAEKSLAEDTLLQLRTEAKRKRVALAAAAKAAEEKLRGATAACEQAAQRGEDEATQKRLAGEREAAGAALQKLRAEASQRRADADAEDRRAEDGLREATAAYEDSARLTERLLRRAAALSLGDRVWLNAEISLALCERARGNPAAGAERLQRIEALCGPAFDLDLLLADCSEAIGRPAEANELYQRYTRKDPLAAKSAFYLARRDAYTPWLILIYRERMKKDPAWRRWAQDLVDAASAGLAIDPDRYILLMFRGEVLARLGKRDDMLADMRRAAELIRQKALAQRYHPLVQANLLVEQARAYSYFDKDMALKAATAIAGLRMDFSDPMYREVLSDARSLIEALRPPEKRPEKPTEGKPSTATPRPETP